MKIQTAKIFGKGLLTGLTLQLAIGPVFFFIINLVLQKTFWDGFVAVLAVTLVDYFYITLSILGIGKLLKNKRYEKPLVIISSLVLIVFGLLMFKTVIINFSGIPLGETSGDLVNSFISTFILTISSPLTIVFFTGIFAAKAIENNFSRKELFVFGFGTGMATFLFIGLSVILFSIIKTAVPMGLMRILNGLVGALLIYYGIFRLIKVFTNK